MLEASLLPQSIDERVEEAINRGLKYYLSKISNGFFNMSVEAPMQLHVMRYIEEELEKMTLLKSERFVIDLEKTFLLNGTRNEVDGIVEYYLDGELQGQYLIEFKYKKEKDGGPNSCNIPAYVDICELEQQLSNPLVKGCYFIFATDDVKYTVPGRKEDANRMVFPLHDGYVIEAREYLPRTQAAVEQLANCGHNNLTFRNEHRIEYSHFLTCRGEDIWYLLLKI